MPSYRRRYSHGIRSLNLGALFGRTVEQLLTTIMKILGMGVPRILICVESLLAHPLQYASPRRVYVESPSMARETF